LHLNDIISVNDKKGALDYSKLIEICGDINEDDTDDIDDTYEIVITISDYKNKALNTNKNFQLLGVSTDLKTFTTKDKKQLNTSLVISLITFIVLYSMT
jgi:ABC-type antimicrobial peptide transport system permease subunit